jgi:SCO1/SenC
MSSSTSNESAPVAEAPDSGRRRGRRLAVTILAVCAAPFVAAWFAYFVWQPQSRMNYGELIESHPLMDPELHRHDGAPFRLSQLRGKWVLLQLDSGACPEACRIKLLYMRQLRLAQGKEMERIERVWLVTDRAAPDPSLLRDYEGAYVVRAVGSPILSEFPATRSANEHIYIVDPLGNLMLRFPKDPEPGRMLQDLARLLKVSRIG